MLICCSFMGSPDVDEIIPKYSVYSEEMLFNCGLKLFCGSVGLEGPIKKFRKKVNIQQRNRISIKFTITLHKCFFTLLYIFGCFMKIYARVLSL